ncbi:MAG: UDP-phosphate galactose phosphotransferase, partial [Cellvibrio sp.]|nr:UDP-phosphate galactose phosphotransferase [Cellvibrio sp.]
MTTADPNKNWLCSQVEKVLAGINRIIVINIAIIRRFHSLAHVNLKESGLSYIRLNKHYIHLPYLYLGVVDALLVAGVAWFVSQISVQQPEEISAVILNPWVPIITLSLVLSCCTLSMGVYSALIREGFSSMVLRTMVSFFLLGSLFLYVINLFFAGAFINQTFIFWSVLLSTLVVSVSRWIFVKIVDTDQLKRRVV